MTRKVRVLFVCVHNSARSQMAAGLLRHLAGETFEVESAGFEPRPVLPEAVAAMARLGIDISEAESKPVFELFKAGRTFGYVIAVCDEAAAERCPVFPGLCERLQWSFPDPASFEGTGAERLRQTIDVRDQIRRRLETWLEELRTTGVFPRFGAGKTRRKDRK